MSEDKELKSWERQKELIPVMVAMYCNGNHGTKKKEMCEECKDLANYCVYRLELCPFKKNKEFCSCCKVHCYKPDYREKIKKVMRYSGPRMLKTHPIWATKHCIATVKHVIKSKKK